MARKKHPTPLEQQLAARRDAIANVIHQAGSQKALGARMGVSQNAISKWLLRGWVPLNRAIEIEAQYGVPRTAIADPRVVSAFASAESMMEV